MLKNITFHSRVLLSIVGILLLAMCGGAITMYMVASRTSVGLAQQQLAVADRVTVKLLGERDRQLRDATNAVAADFGFREAVTSADSATIISALENQGARLRADVTALVDSRGLVTLSTDPELDGAMRQVLQAAIARDRLRNPTVSVVHFRGNLLQLVAVPIRAPDTIGWLCMGFFITNEVLDPIKETTGAEVSLIASGADRTSVVASTLPAASRQALASRINGSHADASVYSLNGQSYLTLVVDAPEDPNSSYSVVTQLPMTVVAAPMAELRDNLLVSGGIITAICLLAALLSARMLIKPVRALGEAARSLSLSKRGGKSNAGGMGDTELASVAKAFHALVRRAHFDALTGLPNRTLFNERLTEGLTRAARDKQRLALVFIDLNGFKAINDKLGHEMGDLVLRKTAQRLSRSISPQNTVARLGGDEFVLILEDVTELEAMHEVERLINIVSLPMKSTGGSIKVGMSAGIAVYPDFATDRDVLLKSADTAMYESKTRKQGPVVAKLGNAAKIPALALPASVPPGRQGDTDTWAGNWEGKDLATQRSKIVQIVTLDKGTWKPAAIPGDEAERLRALRGTGFLDGPRSTSIDRVTRMAAKALRVPIVLVSLVDENRQWFMSRVGLDAEETPRDVSFCAHVVFDRAPLIVCDTTADARFADNALVTGGPNIRAYAGAPLYSKSGFALGTLCAIDQKPHEFTDRELELLLEFTSIVQDMLRAKDERRKARKKAAAR